MEIDAPSTSVKATPVRLSQRFSEQDMDSMLRHIALSLLKGEANIQTDRLSSLLNKAQESMLPKERRHPPNVIYSLVNYRKDDILDRIQQDLSVLKNSQAGQTSVEAVQTNPSQEVVSAIQTPSTQKVKVSDSIQPALGFTSSNVWTTSKVNQVISKMVELSIGQESVDRSDITKLFHKARRQISWPKPVSESTHYNWVWANKPLLEETFLTSLYKSKGQKPTDKVQPTKLEIKEVSALTLGTEDMSDQLQLAMNKVADVCILQLNSIVTSRMNTFSETLVATMKPQIEAAMTRAYQQVALDMENKLVHQVRNREVVRKKVLIIGPIAEQQNKIKQSLENIYDIVFVGSDENPSKISAKLPSAEVVIALTSKISHAHSEALKKHPNVHLVNGGTSCIIEKLEALYIN